MQKVQQNPRKSKKEVNQLKKKFIKKKAKNLKPNQHYKYII